ncbi:MAG: DUF952 domain-containing protein [Acidimicrobiia bacterium]|nr:DUF952 domain-containing protein [Acidimicrobiia bacterium]
MSDILHLATEADWATRGETYAPKGWRQEGFVHCSTSEQLAKTANKHFLGRSDLVLLTIDAAQLVPLVVWEDTAGSGEDFPHIYGEINVDSITSAIPFPAGADGTFDAWSQPR